jgi:hypothetical protein
VPRPEVGVSSKQASAGSGTSAPSTLGKVLHTNSTTLLRDLTVRGFGISQLSREYVFSVAASITSCQGSDSFPRRDRPLRPGVHVLDQDLAQPCEPRLDFGGRPHERDGGDRVVTFRRIRSSPCFGTNALGTR